MKKINTLKEAHFYLDQGLVLVYKNHMEMAFISYNKNHKLVKFNDSVRYTLDEEQLEELFNNNNIYLYEKDDDNEINQEFKKLIQ